MDYKNRLKVFIFALLCVSISNFRASTEEKSSSNTKKNTNKAAEIIVPSLFGLGTGALTMWAEHKSSLADRYLQWRGGATDYWSDNKAMEEGLLYGAGVSAFALGTGTLAFLAARKAYQSKRASSWRERFWNWYNRKPTQPLQKVKETTVTK